METPPNGSHGSHNQRRNGMFPSHIKNTSSNKIEEVLGIGIKYENSYSIMYIFNFESLNSIEETNI